MEPGDNRYVPLQESGRGAVDTIFSTIDLRDDQPTAQFLSGPRCSGKTTEAGRGDRAADLALAALGPAASPDDMALAEANVALALDLKGDLIGALDHAGRALTLDRPLGPRATSAVLDLLARLVAEQSPENRTAVRDLSVSLDRVGDIRRGQGDLAGVLGAYEEGLKWYERLDELYGKPHATTEELALLRARRDALAAPSSPPEPPIPARAADPPHSPA